MNQIQEQHLEAPQLNHRRLRKLTNDNVEKLLKECGQLASFKRSKGTSFGYADYDNLESVLKAMRILHGMQLSGKEIQIKGNEKAQIMIDSWLNKKEQEWDEKKPNPKYSSYNEYMQREDDKIRKKLERLISDLEGTVHKTKNDKKREEEKKEHPREREREAKKQQFKKELERKYEDKKKEWEKKEQDRERERKREAEREQDRITNKQRIKDKELGYDSETERKQLGKAKINERKKFRSREQEEDEIYIKKEQLKLMKPPEPAFEPMQQELPPPPPPIEPIRDFVQEEKQKIDEAELKVKLHEIFLSIPNDREELFNMNINWQLFAQSNLLEKKVRPWLRDRCIEYLTQEEKVFIDAIIKRLFNKEKPQVILNKVVKKVLDDDSEIFVQRMWKMILFELMKLERGLA
ncbi:hypothetical protein pb186bvf_006139 [Paramecium bursaria]